MRMTVTPLSPFDADPLTAAQAVAVFDRLADNPNIPFKFVEMGCDFRAFLMRRALEKEGLTPALAWAVEPRSGTPLHYLSPEGKEHQWWFHVAVALPVISPTGTLDMCVFDPSMYDGPVSLSVWADKMGAQADCAGIDAFDGDVPKDIILNVQKARTRMRDLDYETVTERTNEIFRYAVHHCAGTRVLYASHVRAQAQQESGSPLPTSGRSWMTAKMNEQNPSAASPVNDPRHKVIRP